MASLALEAGPGSWIADEDMKQVEAAQDADHVAVEFDHQMMDSTCDHLISGFPKSGLSRNRER